MSVMCISAAMGSAVLHCALLLLLSGSCQALVSGEEFALSYLQTYKPNWNNPSFQLHITAVQSDVKVNVEVPFFTFWKEEKVEAGKTVTISLPSDNRIYGNENTAHTVRINSTGPVTVTTSICRRYSTDISFILPISEWGTEYFLIPPSGSHESSFKKFSVTNGKEPNEITITMTCALTYRSKNYDEGTQIKVTLEPYESVQFMTKDIVSGSQIRSKKPVAVYMGNTCTGSYQCNQVFKQLVPVSKWGSSFILPPLQFHKSFDFLYVLASQKTNVTVQTGEGKDVYSLNKGELKKIENSQKTSFVVEADHPIQLLVLFEGIQKHKVYSEPFYVNIVPNNRFCLSYVLHSQKGFFSKLLIIVKTNETSLIEVDGVGLKNTLWKKVQGTDFSFTLTEIRERSNGTSAIISSTGEAFSVYTIGLTLRNGYSAPGQCLKPDISCKTVKCSAGYVCKMIDGVPTCVPEPTELTTCWAMGDPHYRTFDGRRFDFMGTCTYVMAKNCGARGLPAFEVLAQNENRGNRKVSYVGLVVVTVYNTTITVVYSENGLVRIDNTAWGLPISLNSGKLLIFQSGRSVVIETDFGLHVRYDWHHSLVVGLPSSYKGYTCGLCGNFNGNSSDDFATPSGSQAGSVVEFGSSWKVPGPMDDAHCRDDCVGGCQEKCEHKLLHIWEGNSFCGIITMAGKNGPFSQCHRLVDPEAYFESCTFDVCIGLGQRLYLCKALEAYADACQSAGVEVYDWRTIARCPAQCPRNSHYELCGSACPATCSDPAAPSKCKRPCIETCTCNKGFVWSGKQCVPEKKCGCIYNGRYVPAGNSFWADEDCGRWCTCDPKDREVRCIDKGCKSGQKCKVRDGIRQCVAVSFKLCYGIGDPHYKTFDGKKFDFQGTCVYQLAALCSKDTELEPFEVNVQNENRGNKVVAYTKLVEVKVYSLSIVISRTHKGLVMVNNEFVNLPISLQDGDVKVYKSGWYAVISTNFGLRVAYNWKGAVFVILTSDYKGAVCGLCGNYNDIPQDDLIPKNGNKPVEPAVFGASWRVAEIPGCLDACEGKCPDCDITEKDKYESNDYCGIIKDPRGPFRDCHAQVDPADAFEDCVFDVCMYEGIKDVLCQAITDYTSACQEVGAEVYSWRTERFCPIKCSANSHYEVCGTACPATCPSLAPPRGCHVRCMEDCICDEGYILSGGVCVPLSHCGCEYEGRYYQIGEVFFPNGKCDEECQCVFEETKKVVCKQLSCGPNEECAVKNGVRKCHPVGEGVCRASGDPHYITFDGKKFDFQGTCTYVLSQSCGIEGTYLTPFSVHVENEEWSRNRRVSVTKLVAVNVYGKTIIMKHNTHGVLVDGIFNNLPININQGAIIVFKEGTNYVIKTDFGLRVSYDLRYSVVVTVPGNYRKKVCGLCGNFNGNSGDDFQLPNKELTTDVNNFGNSWKVNIPNVLCSNGCEGNQCPVCDKLHEAVFSKYAYCGILTAPKGPFASCHSILDPKQFFEDCVFDVCAANGDESVQCDSVAAYAFSCQKAGVAIQIWRSPFFCPMKCPANSHYELCADLSGVACSGLAEIVPFNTGCREGCECDTGFVFNGETCVKEDKCGCSDGQRTYKPGQLFYNEDCSKKCVCNPVKGLVCEDHLCPRGTTCSVKKGVVGCYDKDPCKNANCRKKEKCRVEKDEAVCVPDFTGVCRAWGDPHYITFDNFKYDFQGTCRYVISETCGNLDGLVPFSITERNDNRGNQAVSYVADVEVSVYGYSIIVHKNQVGKVTVDGLLYNLPVVLGEESLVSILKQGHQIKIKTVFGLIVTYDWNHELIIKLPSSYCNLVCGLCGNFNGDKTDEIQNPAGELLSNVVDWAKSWRTPNQKDKKCSDTCQHDCPACDDKQRKVYEAEDLCGALTAKHHNVFEICHEKVDPKPFLDSCVFDMCMNKGDKKILCQTLASYTQQCREEGVEITGWRRKFGCPMNCQPHSHFEECASPCQPTCPFPEQQQICATVCVETCVCDKGYVLSAGVCVPEATCGCSYQGRYYKPGQRFWEGPGCGRLCECDTTLRMVVCDEASCADNEECSVVDWIRACRPKRYATCTAAGDPHYTTFDGRKFDFQGTCKYQLAALCVKNRYLEPFKVTVQNENRGNNLAVSITRTVIIEMYGVTIIISRENPNKIKLDGQLEDLPLQYSDDLWVSHSGQKAVVETAAGITITFDWHHRVSVTLPSKYQGAVCGLCGNYNENPNDDFNKPNGEAADTEVQLGESWRVGIVQGCLSVCQGPRCSRCDGSQKDVYKEKKYCGIIADERGPFKECHSHINNAPYLEDCAFDACQYDGHHGSVCDAIEAYVSACQSAGVEVRPWRTYKFCPMSCPANSHYTLCATSCPATCAIFSQRNCNRPCAGTCECDNGFLLSGGACVPIKDCGCSYGGHYYQSGAVFYPDDKCLEKCVCGKNGAVLCQKTNCRHGEECKLVDGVRGCHPVGEAWCVASGDPHYHTFDGHRFDFQGTCVYILAKVCDDDEGQLTSFTVTQGNEKWGNGNVAVTKSVGVEVYGFVIYIQRGDSWKVKVNGEFVNLPSSLHDGRIQITQEGRNIIVRTDFGLRVQYDTVYYVEVIVPSTYWRRMCGLCGNYNKKPDDDFLLPNGKFTNDVDVFGKAWAVELLGFDCGGCGSQCPVCDPAKAAVLGKPDFCGIIQAYDGPFKECHSRINPLRYFSDCVFDVCEDKDALCDSIMAYALACQSAGVQIQQWRSDSFCSASCPENSHYELCADTCGSSCVGLLKAVSCSENCFEGCQCDQGFVFDGEQCVSPSKCGCLHNDRYLKVGESVVDPQCQSSCVCQAPGIVKCEKKLCGSSEVCEVRDGVRDCHPTQGQCSIDKAAHLSTFDGLTGPMADLGAFEVASLWNFTDARWFRVVVDVRRCGNGSLAVDAVYVFFKNYSIAVNGQQEVWVNGRKTSLPVRLGCDVSVHISENSVVIERTSIVSITFSLWREVVVIVDSSLTHKICGACGNFNHDPKDDLTTADGETAMDLVKVVWSWLAEDFSRCGL